MKVTDKNYCFCNNADFLPLNLATGKAVIRKKDDSPELRECIKNPGHFLNDAEIVKDSRTTKAGLLKLPDGKEVFIKCFNRKGFLYTLKYMFREARPFRVWKAAWCFEKAGIPTPRPMAALATYKNGIPGNAYLIRNTVPDVVPTLEFFNQLMDNEQLKNSYLSAIALMIAKMHDAGIYHGDAKCSNIYVEKCGENKYSYGLWDLLSCRVFNKPLPKVWREKEISHIAWSFAEISNRQRKTVDEEDIYEQLSDEYEKANRLEVKTLKSTSLADAATEDNH